MIFCVRRLRLLALLACLLAGLSAAPSAAPARAKRSWAQAEIRTVVARGLMATSVAAFRPNDPLTQGELRNLLVGLSQESPPPSPQPPARPDRKSTRLNSSHVKISYAVFCLK